MGHTVIDFIMKFFTPKDHHETFGFGTFGEGFDLKLTLFQYIISKFVPKLMFFKFFKGQSSISTRILDIPHHVAGIGGRS
mmetsp:Transcript_15785/g.44990  ORF Transcript_15785/g.44990 Transcript_15785/m.44990 type:complete len:80 (-) Transcript_15785:151-390(-)